VSSRAERPGQTSETSGSAVPTADVPAERPRPDAKPAAADVRVERTPVGERTPAGERDGTESPSDGFLSSKPTRARLESVFVRLIATAGVIGVGTALGAVLVANDVTGWIVGLVVSVVCVLCAAVLWRSRQL
jgi:hypothetical protein